MKEVKEFNKQTEDELFEQVCDMTHEIAYRARHIVDLQKEINTMNDKLNLIEAEMELRETKGTCTHN